MRDIKNFFLKPEETKERKEEFNKRIQELGYLPLHENYESGTYIYQEALEREPEEYIIPECIPACKELWKKNIYTFMTGDYLDEESVWIEINAEALSEENKDIFLKLENKGAKLSCKTKGFVRFGVAGVGKEAQEELLEYAKEFQMQDVSSIYAYTTPTQFLIDYCDCYVEVKNPNYQVKLPPMDLDIPKEQWNHQQKEFQEWLRTDTSRRTIKLFDISKMTKFLEEYVKEHNMILDDTRVYLSPFHYEKHKNYLSYLSQQPKQFRK